MHVNRRTDCAGDQSPSPQKLDIWSRANPAHIGLMFLVIVSGALCFSAVKSGLAYAPPLRFSAIRGLIAAAGMIIVLAASGKPLWPGGGVAKWILPLALSSSVLTFGAMFMSAGLAGAGIAAVLGNTQSFAAVLLAAAFLGEKITLGKVVALALGLGGIGLIAAPAIQNENLRAFSGQMLALASSLGAAASSVMLRRARPGRNLVALTAWQLVAGSFALLGISYFLEPAEPIAWTWHFTGLLLLLSLVVTPILTLSWFWLLQKYEAGGLSLNLFLGPVLGLFFAYLFFGETLGALEIAGVLLVLAGLGYFLLAQRTAGRGAGRHGDGGMGDAPGQEGRRR